MRYKNESNKKIEALEKISWKHGQEDGSLEPGMPLTTLQKMQIIVVWGHTWLHHPDRYQGGKEHWRGSQAYQRHWQRHEKVQ